VKRIAIALSALALVFVSSAALAQTDPGSVALNWDQCYGDGPIYNKIFACNTNAGFDQLVVSATPSADVLAMVAAAVTIDLTISGSSLTPWWTMDTNPAPPGCRSGALSASFVAPTVSACVDPWQGNASGGIDYQSAFNGPDRARMRLVCAVPAPVPVLAHQELFIARVVIFHTKTMGTGFCTGCVDPMCLMLSSVQLDQNPGLESPILVLPKPGTDSDLLTWQPGGAARRQIFLCPPGVPNCSGKQLSCPSVTPALRSTWGAIKSMYR